MNAIRKLTLHITMTNVKVFFDSRINLDWLKSSPNDFKLLVARRLVMILKIRMEFNASFYHIPGTNNIADLFSRLCDPSE